jgi:two-component sensor histidine kinase
MKKMSSILLLISSGALFCMNEPDKKEDIKLMWKEILNEKKEIRDRLDTLKNYVDSLTKLTNTSKTRSLNKYLTRIQNSLGYFDVACQNLKIDQKDCESSSDED